MTVTLSSQATGPRDEAAHAPAVILLGSLGSDLSMWAPQVERLSDRFRVVAIDHPGHGGSPLPEGRCTIATLAEAVLAVLDSLDIDEAHIVGLSLGGAVAQWLAAHSPSRIRTLSLLCTAAKFGEPQGWIDRAAVARNDGTESLADAVVDRWFTDGFAAENPEFVARHRAMIAATSNEGYAACCEALSDWDFAADLGLIAAPTLVLAGEEDPSTPPSVMQVLADGIADAHFEVLSPAAHLPNLEQPTRVTELLRAHFDARTPSRDGEKS